ncbi:unnamed protein product [Notodromas monacha]|uniref:phosphatidylinositol-4,5-bisphosphate 4-phosphatase n=1 Tax=Notodromas monacha TaxID=399045 RepID=A0A7R9BQ88_9CRUS|nr:unnamed protein product [Notodromas monacha]CAG0918572.1 unnamed protein product [Notodromas monacha]
MNDLDVSAYLKELSLTAKKTGEQTPGAQGAKPVAKRLRFGRKVDERRVSESSPAPVTQDAFSEDIPTAFQKFQALDKKYSKRSLNFNEEKSESLSVTVSSTHDVGEVPDAVAPTSVTPVLEKEVSEKKETENDRNEINLRRFSVSMEEIHSVEELDSLESRKSDDAPSCRSQVESPKISLKTPVSVVDVSTRRTSRNEEVLRPIHGPTIQQPESARHVCPTKTMISNSSVQTVDLDMGTYPSRLRHRDASRYLQPNFVEGLDAENSHEAIRKKFMKMQIDLIASNVYRQKKLYSTAIDNLIPDHVYRMSDKKKRQETRAEGTYENLTPVDANGCLFDLLWLTPWELNECEYLLVEYVSAYAEFPPSAPLAEYAGEEASGPAVNGNRIPMVSCRVCQAMIDISDKRDQHVVKCTQCREATVSFEWQRVPRTRKIIRCIMRDFSFTYENLTPVDANGCLFDLLWLTPWELNECEYLLVEYVSAYAEFPPSAPLAEYAGEEASGPAVNGNRIPMVSCRVCQAMIDISDKRDQHVVKCTQCREATPIKNAPMGKKYVRCPCNCLLICKDTSQRIACPRPNCKKIINLAPINPPPAATPSMPGMCHVCCAHCREIFLRDSDEVPMDRLFTSVRSFQFNSLTNVMARCPHCRKVSSVGVDYTRRRKWAFLVLGLIALAVGLGVTFGTMNLASHYGGLYVIHVGAFLIAIVFLCRALYFHTMKVSHPDRPLY